MIIVDELKNRGIENVVCYSGKDITTDLIERCFKLDAVFYKSQFQWNMYGIEEIILKYNEMCFIFVDKIKNNIVGYSYWFPLKLTIINEHIKIKEPLLNIKDEYCSPFNISPVNLFLGGEAFVPGYDLMTLHKAVEDIFQYHVLCLAQKGIKIGLVCFDAVCRYDNEFLVNRTNLKNKTSKKNCDFYYDMYSPETIYNESIYTSELKKYYN